MPYNLMMPNTTPQYFYSGGNGRMLPPQQQPAWVRPVQLGGYHFTPPPKAQQPHQEADTSQPENTFPEQEAEDLERPKSPRPLTSEERGGWDKIMLKPTIMISDHKKPAQDQPSITPY